MVDQKVVVVVLLSVASQPPSHFFGPIQRQ
jgi:hypothetical protein